MKTTDPRDPLDQKIDALLASQPVNASSDFSERLLAEIEALPPRQKPSTLAPLIRFALPLAAALALAFVVLHQWEAGHTAPPPNAKTNSLAASNPGSEALDNYEIQELLMLQDGLSGFAQTESDQLDGSDLLDILDSLYSI